MLVFTIILIILLTLIAIWDYQTEEIPHTLTIATLIMGIISLIFFADKWYIPLILGLIIFIGYAIMFFITDKIGGGDVKILAISFLLLHDLDMILTYCIIFTICLMYGCLLTLAKNKKSLRLGPYMSFGLIGTYIFTLTNSIESVLISAIYFILFVEIINQALFYKRKVILDYEKLF